MHKIAIAHDYLTQRGGAERVVLAIANAFPGTPIYTTLYNPATTFPEFANHDVRTSWVNRIPAFRRNHRIALPLLAAAANSLRIDAELVIASSSGWAHGFDTSGHKLVYCYSPARWLYQQETYLGQGVSSIGQRLALRALGPHLRAWDRAAAASADHYLAISTVVRERIKATYGINADILPAPFPNALTLVDPEPLPPHVAHHGSYFLCVSRLLPYKNVESIIDAFKLRPDYKLVIVGDGPDYGRLVSRLPHNVKILRGMTDGEMRWLYENCTGLVAASFEDFGLTPLEAAAHGKPSAVLRAGGFLDTMKEGSTAVFFDSPTPDLIVEALDALRSCTWDPSVITRHAARFSEASFVAKLTDAIRCLSDAPVRD